MKKECVFPARLAKPRVAYSPVVKAGPLVFVSGQLASDFTTGIPPEVSINPAFPHHESAIERQAAFVYRNLGAALEAGGSSLDRCLFLALFHTEPAEIRGAVRVGQQVFQPDPPPPQTTVILEELPVPEPTLEVDAVAAVSDGGFRPVTVESPRAAAPVLKGSDGKPLYRQAVKAGPLVFTAGITATDFADGVAPQARLHPSFPYYGESAQLQTRYALNALKAILEEAGASLADVVKAEVFLTDLRDFFGMERVWKEYFPADPPARTTVPVKGLGVPGLRVAVNLIALIPQGKRRKTIIATDRAPAPLAHEPQAVKAGPYLFLSNQFATDFRSGVAPEARVNPNFPFYARAAEREVNYIVKNVDAICRAAGSSLQHLLRRRAFHTEFNEFDASFAAWAAALPSEPPASTTVRVPGPLLIPGCTIELDLVAVIPDEDL